MPATMRSHAATCLFVVALVCIYYVVIAPFFVGHYDLGWHLAAGDLIRTQGSVPEHDPWSFTAGTKQWFNLSWLWDVINSLLFEAGGFTAIILETLLVGVLVAVGLFAICVANGAAPLAAAVAVFLACILYPAFAAPDIFLGATPGVITVLGCVVFYAACLKPRALWMTPPTMVLWVNMHGGFVVGPALIGAFMAMAVLRGELAVAGRYALFLAISVAATLINPLGVHVYQGLLGTLGHFALQYITEWQPFFRVVPFPQAVPFCMYALLFAVLELADWRRGRIEARLLSWCFLAAGLWKLRYLSMFFVFSSLPIAVHLGNLLPGLLARPTDNHRIGISGLIVLFCLPLLYARVVPPGVGFLPQTFPEQEIDYLSAQRPHARLLNHWNYGGFLIFKTRGAIPVFVDGRSATAYPDDLLRAYFALSQWEVDPAAWEGVLQRYDIDTVMWPKAHLPLQQYLTASLGWRLAYVGPIANIYVRP